MSVARDARASRGLAMLVTLGFVALFVSATAADASPRKAHQGRWLGLTALGEAACGETDAFCETTVLPALREDPELVFFLADVRAAAKKNAARNGGGFQELADAYRAIVTRQVPRLRFPELLALGCCLSAGECLDDILGEAPAILGEAPGASQIDALDASRALAAQTLTLAADAPEAATKMPAATLLGANANACRPPFDQTRCGATVVALYRRAGNQGFEIGVMRAGEVLLARFAGKFVDGTSEHSCFRNTTGGDETKSSKTPAGDLADAAAARALFKGLLVSSDFDKRALLRLKELSAVEERWLTSRDGSGSGGHGNKDAAYVLAGVLVDGAVRFVLVTFLFVAAYAFRNTRLGQSTRAFVWHRSGYAHVANSVRKTKEAFGLVPHRRVNGGRAERKHEAKKLAKQIVKDAKKAKKQP